MRTAKRLKDDRATCRKLDVDDSLILVISDTTTITRRDGESVNVQGNSNVATMPVFDVNGHPYISGYIQRPAASSVLIGIAIWIPSIFLCAILFLSGLERLAVLALGLGFAIHSLLANRVAVYVLLMGIFADHIVGSGVARFQMGKMVGVWLLLLSIPKILRAVSSPHYDRSAKWIVLFVVICLLTIPLSPSIPHAVIFTISVVLIYSMVLLICLHLTHIKYFNTAVLSVIGMGLVFGIQFIFTGAAEEIAKWEQTTIRSVVGESGFDINEVARLMSLSAIACIYMFFLVKGMVKKSIFVAVGMIICIGIVITKSRASYVFLPITIVLAAWLSRHVKMHMRLWITGLATFFVVVIFFLGGKVGFAGAGVQQRIESIFSRERGSAQGLRSRLRAGYAEMALRRGFMGYGLKGVAMSRAAHEKGIVWDAHNDLFDITANLGIIGLVAFLGLHGSLFLRIRRMRDPRQSFLALMIWLFILLAGLTETDYQRKYYAAALGMIIALLRLSEQQESDELHNYRVFEVQSQMLLQNQ